MFIVIVAKKTQTSESEFEGLQLQKVLFLSRARSAKKILEFGGFGKKINRQLRMKVQTYVNKCLVTDTKGTFYCACAMKEIPNFGNL